MDTISSRYTQIEFGSYCSAPGTGCALVETNAEMFEYIRTNLNFDQIIWEFGTDTNPDWVHVSYVSEEQNRKRCLKASRENGKTVYSII